jgi:hypothetical protein
MSKFGIFAIDDVGAWDYAADTRGKPGTLKYGFGMSFDEDVTKKIGVFERLGRANGQTEDFGFAAIDRRANAYSLRLHPEGKAAR